MNECIKANACEHTLNIEALTPSSSSHQLNVLLVAVLVAVTTQL